MRMSEEVENANPNDPPFCKNGLYHERQWLQLCLLHTLNCLFQRKEFSKSDLDRIAESLHDSHWFNRHRSIMGTGNYDVNVLIASLQSRGLSVVWFDVRRSARCIILSKVIGFIFNSPSRSFFPFWNGRHWFAVREVADAGYFNFDSKLPEPAPVPDFVEFADKLLAEGNQMMLVVRPENIGCCMSK
ncbi:hypothetical protein AB6A40_001697 [Gnathostoma spinigerum]|uniref:ubiquitinyl hydrolase 1 n=1 Tax=Gnathostoma spinigerum TaxID=75299 RepID=A0ABD6E4X3_9BILA